MALNAIDLSKLPPPFVVETLDFDAIVTAIEADLLERAADAGLDLAPVLALESEPLVKLMEACAYRELVLRSRINEAARQTMLAFATGTNLDAAAANLAVTREDGETDDALRTRASIAPESWSAAGPTGAYLFFAKSASPLVADVQATSPTPGQVLVTVLSDAADGIADGDLLDLVETALSGDQVRPFCEEVLVESATIASYDVMATLYLADGPDEATVLAAATAAVQAYCDSRRRLGKGVALAGIEAALMQSGVENVGLDGPLDDIIGSDGVAPVLGGIYLSTAAAP